MFWTRARREERRQRVIDELLDIAPEERRQRLDLAVAAGDIHKNEVDGALQLVQRLDALRAMTIPPNGHTASGVISDEAQPAALEGEPVDPGASQTPASEGMELALPEPADDTELSAPAPPPGPAELEPPTGAEPEPAVSWLFSAPLPIDAVEAAGRLLARDVALRRVRAGAHSSRQRRLRSGAGGLSLQAQTVAPLPASLLARVSAPLPATVVAEPGTEAPFGEYGPTISWLRP